MSFLANFAAVAWHENSMDWTRVEDSSPWANLPTPATTTTTTQRPLQLQLQQRAEEAEKKVRTR